MHIRHLSSYQQVAETVRYKRHVKLFYRTRGLTVGITITKDEVKYAFANCSTEDQFNRKIGFKLVNERMQNAEIVPVEVIQKLFAKDFKIDLTLLNPQLVLATVTEYVINNKI